MIVCLSGIDGCGKGTQKELLSRALRSKKISVFLSKAYGDCEKECFSPFIEYWSQEAILFLFQALHIEQRLRAEEALQHNDVVIADRWDESYVAYHSSYGILANDPKLRNRLNEIAFGGTMPDITFLLDISPEKARKRLDIRGADFFDKLPKSYHNTMRKEYLRLAKERSWIILDGNLPVSELHKTIFKKVMSKLV